MRNSQAQPMEQASKVLNLETVLRINQTPSINVYGMRILDRWAAGQPEALKDLEAALDGPTSLLMKVIGQQRVEQDILTSLEAQKQRESGLAEHEILALHEVKLEL